jgi:hypothetical protein
MGAHSVDRRLGCHEVCSSKIRFKECQILVLGILLWGFIADFESFPPGVKFNQCLNQCVVPVILSAIPL